MSFGGRPRGDKVGFESPPKDSQPASQAAPISARRWGGDKDGTDEDAPETAARTTDSCDSNVVKGIEVDLGMLHSVNLGGFVCFGDNKICVLFSVGAERFQVAQVAEDQLEILVGSCEYWRSGRPTREQSRARASTDPDRIGNGLRNAAHTHTRQPAYASSPTSVGRVVLARCAPIIVGEPSTLADEASMTTALLTIHALTHARTHIHHTLIKIQATSIPQSTFDYSLLLNDLSLLKSNTTQPGSSKLAIAICAQLPRVRPTQSPDLTSHRDASPHPRAAFLHSRVST